MEGGDVVRIAAFGRRTRRRR